ncbi:MAG: FKBP-type peptidyl-prolyl cis-trans isomerase [Pseudomonadales bacterium]
MLFVRNLLCSAPIKGSAARPGLLGLAAAGVLAVTLAGCDGAGNDGAVAEAELETDAAKASYSLGYRFADNVQRNFEDEIDNDAFVRGVRDNLAGEEALIGEEEAERVLTGMMEARQAAMAGEAVRNLERGLEFLAENSLREEVVALESGLQYEVLEQAEGASPDANDVVTTHYEGRLIDGTVFDSSYERGEPATFPLDRVIPGWTEGLQLMSEGEKFRLYVPPHLAYGERVAGNIPPNSTLIFDVELLAIESDDAGAGAP